MAIRERGEFWYGDAAADIREVLARTCGGGDTLTVFEEAVCDCGGRVFSLTVDEDYAEVTWACRACDALYLFHTSGTDGYFEGDPAAEHEDCGCPCNERETASFEIAVGAVLYDDGQDVRWVYIGCRCISCGLTALYADWNRVDLSWPDVVARMRNKLKDE